MKQAGGRQKAWKLLQISLTHTFSFSRFLSGGKNPETPRAKIHDERLKKVVDAMLKKDEHRQFEVRLKVDRLRNELRINKKSLGEILDASLDEDMKRAFADTYDSYYLYVPLY